MNKFLVKFQSGAEKEIEAEYFFIQTGTLVFAERAELNNPDGRKKMLTRAFHRDTWESVELVK